MCIRDRRPGSLKDRGGVSAEENLRRDPGQESLPDSLVGLSRRRSQESDGPAWEDEPVDGAAGIKLIIFTFPIIQHDAHSSGLAIAG